jgi:hypothetical protein
MRHDHTQTERWISHFIFIRTDTVTDESTDIPMYAWYTVAVARDDHATMKYNYFTFLSFLFQHRHGVHAC